MINLNFSCDYLLCTPIDGDLFRIEGQAQGAPIIMMVVEFQPIIVMDTKCIPEPNVSPKTQCVHPSEGYVIEATLEGETLSLKGHKPSRLPALGIF